MTVRTLTQSSLGRPWGVLVLAAALAACSGSTGGESDSGVREFPATGLVVAAPADGMVSIAHEEIAGFMPAMTMPFVLADPVDAARLAPGDRVRFTLSVGQTTSRARAVEVIGQDLAALEVHRRAVSASAARVRTGDPLPPFSLVDQDGQPVTAESLRGHRTLLTFVFTRCPVPEFCPRISGAFRRLSQAMAPEADLADVRLLSITLDPAFDTPAVLKAYGESMGADFSRWRFATGQPADVAALTRAFAVRAEPSSAIIDHTLATALVGTDGQVVEIWRGNQWTVEEVLARLRS